MFLGHGVDVKHLLRERMNEIEIVFDPAYNISEELRDEHGHRLCWNGHYGRVYVRKAQYHFGWNWGPSFVTCGPWKLIYLEWYTGRIGDLYVDVNLRDDFSVATVTVEFTTEPDNAAISLKVELYNSRELILAALRTDAATLSFDIDSPELWYPSNG